MKPTSKANSANSPEPTFTADDLLSSLTSLLGRTGGDDGRTVNEIIDATGWSKDKVKTALKKAQTAGRLTCGHAYRLALDGIQRPVPVYRILEG